jgi:hypothetical protein
MEEVAMATQAVMLQSGANRREFWNLFQAELAARVGECNAIADEPLWTVSAAGDPIYQIVVARRGIPGERVECVFHAAAGVLICTPGPAVNARPLQFEYGPETWTVNGCACSPEEAIRLVLDELVTSDED